MPFEDKALPGWLHLPVGYSGGRIPAVVSIPGMDGFKEASVSMYGDRWLSRGIAVLTIEGPGQYESAVHGIPVSMFASRNDSLPTKTSKPDLANASRKSFVLFQSPELSFMGLGMATAESALSEDWTMSAASAWFIGPCEGQTIEAESTVIHQGKLVSLLRTRVIGKDRRLATEVVTTHSRKMR